MLELPFQFGRVRKITGQNIPSFIRHFVFRSFIEPSASWAERKCNQSLCNKQLFQAVQSYLISEHHLSIW